jgi:hypothetical protein
VDEELHKKQVRELVGSEDSDGPTGTETGTRTGIESLNFEFCILIEQF